MANLPPPAPPESRTAGQLVAEALRLYGNRFWAVLGLGVPPVLAGAALVAIFEAGFNRPTRLTAFLVLGSLAFAISYIGASVLASGRRPASHGIALGVAVLVFVPVPFLLDLGFILIPALVWFTCFGLAVPVAVVEERGIVGSLRRALQLARADFVHALGSLAAVIIVSFVSAGVLWYLLVQFGETTGGLAAFIAVFLLSPLVLLAAALLYFDQEARLRAQ